MLLKDNIESQSKPQIKNSPLIDILLRKLKGSFFADGSRTHAPVKSVSPELDLTWRALSDDFSIVLVPPHHPPKNGLYLAQQGDNNHLKGAERPVIAR